MVADSTERRDSTYSATPPLLTGAHTPAFVHHALVISDAEYVEDMEAGGDMRLWMQGRLRSKGWSCMECLT